jgi:hypothetical protein
MNTLISTWNPPGPWRAARVLGVETEIYTDWLKRTGRLYPSMVSVASQEGHSAAKEE